MKPQKHKNIMLLLKVLPLIACAVLMFLFLASGKKITVEAIINYTPESPFAAAMVVLLLYALKSISFVFPIVVLQIATGHLFRTPAALLINFTGRVVTLTIPYWVGRFSGSGLACHLREKYPKLEEICARHGQRPVFISFLPRTLCFLPGDAVSLYLGAIKIPFPCYLAGGVLGTLLGVVLSTVLGSGITEPGSPAFLLSAALMGFVGVVSFLYYLQMNRKGK